MKSKREFKQKIPFIGKEFFFDGYLNIGWVQKRPEKVGGHLNRTLDGYFVPYLDYDNLAYHWLVSEANILQTEFKLSDFYLFHAEDHEDGWNVMMLDKLNLRENIEVLNRSTCDWNYKRGYLFTPSRSWTLRVTEKGERKRVDYFGVIPSDYQEREKSRAHAEMLEMFGAPINWNRKYDNFHLDTVVMYEGVRLFNGMRDKHKYHGVTSEVYNTGSHLTKKSVLRGVPRGVQKEKDEEDEKEVK